MLCEVTYPLCHALHVFDSFRKHFPYHTAVVIVIHPVTSVLLFRILAWHSKGLKRRPEVRLVQLWLVSRPAASYN